MRLKQGKLVWIFPLVMAFWPVWQWYAGHLRNAEGGLAGLAPLVPLGFYLGRRWREKSNETLDLTLPIGFTLVYLVGFPFVPPLVRAMMAITALCSFLSAGMGVKFDFNMWGLGLLTLPVIPTLQFFGGYPLRVLAGGMAAFILRLSGLPILLDGTSLNWGGKLISIDAPCSGIQMLWAGGFLVLTLMMFLQTPFRRALTTLALAVPVIIFGNTLRTVTLFYVETKIIPLPSWSHQFIGVSGFLVTGIALLLLVFGLEKRNLWKKS